MNNYTLTAKELDWIDNRERHLRCFGGNLACTPGMHPWFTDWKDAAEFEARVAECIAENFTDLDDRSSSLQFLDGLSAKSQGWYILKEARMYVEKKIEDEGK